MRFLGEKHLDKKTKAWGERLSDRSRKMFSAWQRREEMTGVGFNRSMLPHRDRFLETVRKPPDATEADNLAGRFALIPFQAEGSDKIESYDLSQDSFRLMFESGVKPTNNHSEQQIRHCVIDRRPFCWKQGFWKHRPKARAAGQRYHERMWTAIATCTKQDRSFLHFLHFLHKSIEANINGLSGLSPMTEQS